MTMSTHLLPALRRAVLCLSLFLVAPVAWAQTETTLTAGDDEYKIEFLGATVSGGNTTFTYRVTEVKGKDLSNFVLQLCIEDEDDLISTDPHTDEIHVEKVEEKSGLFGVKWDLRDSFTSGEFSFTLAGTYPTGSTSVVAAKFGGTVVKGSIDGPDCEADVCVPANKPSWDGNFTGNDPGPGQGFFLLQTPQGFQQIELTLHENIAITGLAEADGTPIGDVNLGGALAGSVGNGFSFLEYTGATLLTEVRINVTALEQSGSRFMFQVADKCDFTAQLDPVVQLAAPSAIALEQNYPNPFNPQTSIRFQLPEAAAVTLRVYDVLGRQVKTLLAGEMGAGDHEAVWDGTDASGLRVPSGVYLYRLEAGNVVRIRQMTMMK